MVTYLSDEWLEQASVALATSEELSQRSGDLDLKIGYLVADAPTGKVAYTVSFDHGTVSLTPGTAGKLVDAAPVATPANLMVMEPGGYRFGDYWKLGLPLMALFAAAAVLLVPVIWSF